jgi:hypothetical protein
MTISHDELKRLLHYDPETGVWTRLTSDRANYRVGDRADHARNEGYRVVVVKSLYFKAHRLAWFYMLGSWPIKNLDHRNNIKGDNRWKNLREATRSQNTANTPLRRSGTKTGLKGVVKCPRCHFRWQARITVAGKCHYLGQYNCPAAAHLAYLVAAYEAHGDFVRAR